MESLRRKNVLGLTYVAPYIGAVAMLTLGGELLSGFLKIVMDMWFIKLYLYMGAHCS
jgi:hypothetical protein